MLKAELRAPLLIQAPPIFERCVEQPECADDVRFDERRRSINRTVDMRFRRQMHDRVGLLVGEDAAHLPAVANVGLIEAIVRRTFHRAQRLEAARVSELVDVDDVVAARHEVPHDSAADESGAARDHDLPSAGHLQLRLDLGEQRRRPILLRHGDACRIHGPRDAHRRVVEADRAIMRR